MTKLVKYKTGEIYRMEENTNMGIQGGEIIREVDITNKTPQEIAQVEQDLKNH